MARKSKCEQGGRYVEWVPAPLTLIKHYVRLYDVQCVRRQAYLNPHPQELMLRNRV